MSLGTQASDVADWALFARTADYGLNGGLPLAKATVLRVHLGVDTATVVTAYTTEAFEKLGPSRGIELWRNGRREFSGSVRERSFTRDDEGLLSIKVVCFGDAVHLADRITFPDPLRAPNDQTVNNYWTYTGVASTAMRQLISDQAGPSARADRRVPGLTMGADPGVGLSRKWSGLFEPVLSNLAGISVLSGVNLGVRVRPSPGALTVDIVRPRDLASLIRFSADLSNLGAIEYRETAATATHVVTAGQGDLNARMRAFATTTDPLATQWGRQVWAYVDRRDTDDPAELLQAAQDALSEGGATVSLAVTLLDSDAATYGTDWDVGDRVTVYVGVEGQPKPATVVDVIREVQFEVDADGAETIRPAIGSFDAKAIVPTPTQQQLARIGKRLGGLETRT